MGRMIGFYMAVLGVACYSHAALVGYWNFSETSGTVAHNQVAGGPDGTLMGGSHFATTSGLRDPHCIRLDNVTNDLVDFGNNYNFTSSFSIVAWVKIDAGNTMPMVPVSKFGTLSPNGGYFLGVGKVSGGQKNPSDGFPQFVESGYSTTQVSPAINDGTWHLIAGVYDASVNSAYMYNYNNGGGGISGVPTPVGSTADFLIGGFTSGLGLANAFSGYVDEVRVYDSAITDLDSIYRATIPEPTESSLFFFVMALSLLSMRL